MKSKISKTFEVKKIKIIEKNMWSTKGKYHLPSVMQTNYKHHQLNQLMVTKHCQVNDFSFSCVSFLSFSTLKTIPSRLTCMFVAFENFASRCWMRIEVEVTVVIQSVIHSVIFHSSEFSRSSSGGRNMEWFFMEDGLGWAAGSVALSSI